MSTLQIIPISPFIIYLQVHKKHMYDTCTHVLVPATQTHTVPSSGLEATYIYSRENLALRLVPQTAAATWRVLCAVVRLLFSLCCHSLGSLSYLLCLQVVVFLFLFFQLVLFKCLPHRLRGGARQLFLLFFVVTFFLFPFRFVFFVSFRFYIS